jgi:hypothetical protein
MRSKTHQAPERPAQRAWLHTAGCVTMLLTLLAGASLRAAAESTSSTMLLVIAHGAVPEHQLDIDDLRAVFLRKRLTWSNGQTVIPINYPSGDPVRLAFDRAVLGFSSEESSRYWIDERIRHGTQAPRSIAGEAVLVRVVTALPGSISYKPVGQPLSQGAGIRVLARIQAGRVLPP